MGFVGVMMIERGIFECRVILWLGFESQNNTLMDDQCPLVPMLECTSETAAQAGNNKQCGISMTFPFRPWKCKT